MVDGLPEGLDEAVTWDIEPNIPKVANKISGRVNRLKGLGNAIVPQVAVEIYKAIINHYENES